LGLNTRESMVSIFEHVRDIPFEIPSDPAMYDPATAPSLILQRGCGSCAAKHFLLAKMYRKLNVNVVFATFAFLWNDPGLHYPEDLRALAARLPVAYHLACRVQAGCRWVLVDATWDRPLRHAGFPVNLHWDGSSEMQCAVRPLKAPVRTAFCRTVSNEPCRDDDAAGLVPVDGEKDYWEAGDVARSLRERIPLRTAEETEALAGFHRTFNGWLPAVRASARD
jgi:hypothetical protein